MTPEAEAILKKQCLDTFTDCNVCFVDFPDNIEITSGKTDKGLAILEYCRLKHIREDEVVVIGDSGNDIAMLKRFENSYAMGNADAETKKAARHVALSNSEQGVARLLHEICDMKG